MQYKFKDTPHKAQNAFDEGLYSFRKSPNVLDGAYDRLLLNKVVGGTLAVNQLCNPANRGTVIPSGPTITYNNDGSFTFNGTVETRTSFFIDRQLAIIPNHKYMISGYKKVGSNHGFMGFVGYSTDRGNGGIFNNTLTGNTTVFRIDFYAGETFDNVTMTPQVTDITQFCGSTIADYVYNLEQSTAGSGVAWLKQHFPSVFNSYQPYNAGTLESVEASEHVMTGFNQWDEEWEVGRYVNGVKDSVNNQIRCKNRIPILPNTKYYMKNGSGEATIQFLDGSGGFISTAYRNNADFTTPANAYYLVFTMNSAYGTTYNNDICINLDKTTGTPKNGDYEAYTQTSYPLDSDLVLRGVPKISNGVPYYDGDTYESDGTVTRKYGIVDFSDFTFGTVTVGTSGGGIKYADVFLAGIEPNARAISNKYTWLTVGDIGADGTFKTYGTAFTIYDNRFADAETAKSILASEATTIVYLKATPTTETADPYTNPQVVYADGTEEFTDFAVASGRRDISLPVQCESMYYEAVPLPAEALSINGKFIEDVIDGYRTLNVTGRETMAQEVKEAEVGKHDGAFFQYRRYPTRDIVVKYQIIAESNEAYRNAFIKLNQMLDFSEGVLIFNDETDKSFVGTPTDVELPEPGLNCAVGEFTLHCEDPFKYSVQEKSVAMQSDANGYFFGLDYKGTHKSYPRIETDFYKTDTEDDDNGECSFISFMKTDGKILLFGDPENTDANRAPVRIFQRASSAPAVPSSQVTFSFESQTVTNPSALGSWSTTIPSGESTLWTTMAIAESTATNAYINQADWSTVEQYANQDDSALYSINSKTEVNKKFTSQGTAWASNSGKIYNNWPETGTPGIVTPRGGNKYITASDYGSGSDWHGPSVTRTKSDDIRDFLFTFNYAFYQGTGDQASKQTGLLQAVLWNSTQNKIIAALSFWKNSGNSKGSIRMVVGGKSVKTLSEVPFGILTQTVTTDANACSIKKIGSTVIFNVKGTEYRFVDESIKETATDKVTFYFAKKGTTTAMDEIGVHSAQLIKYYQPVSPNPFTSNDELRIDTKNTAVQLNGLDAQGLGALANDWEGFYLKPGRNLIGVVWSEYVPSTYKPTCRLYYREVYL